ncbi:MAG: NADH-quinone oxidoreductase subunit NuoG [Beijerinckiaceae bacterium]|nr:NADH-quinone oxidoreductase subunit NuoG [Beijerinckiaceae bacterium]
MTKILVDDVEVDVPPHYTLLQAAEAAGAEVPRFCFHERLSIAGNCRMCLVEVKGGPPKPQASCAMNVRDVRGGPDGSLPQIFTKSPMVKKAREGVMEFLLINHPLDCPICDQGGECDLQDQAMAYGVDSTRYQENKRAVEDKYIGPLVKTVMTRCIHCTRCVRFTTEVAGITELGLIGRGEDAEITTYLEKAMTSEMQGNVIDLCPVGALTSRPYEFNARPWELTKTESIDVMDALGSAIRVDTRGREVMRVMPRINEAVNEEWISDKTRFIWDGLKTQRLDRPYLRENGALRPASWAEAFSAIAAKVKAAKPERIGALAGQLAGVEEMFALKALMTALGSANLDCRYPGSPLHPKNGRASYLFNATIAGIEEADSILLIGTNPRKEAAVLNARIRKRYLKGGVKIALIGEQADLSYPHAYLGAGPDSLAALLKEPKDEGAKKPMIILGQGALNRADGAAILAMAAQLAEKQGVIAEGWNGFCVLHTEAALVGALDLGFVPGEGGLDTAGMLAPGALDVLFNLGADEVEIPAGAFVIYQGTHGDKGAHRADVILPGAAYTEKSATYVNTEGRVQMTNRAGFPPGDAREDWAILRALSAQLGQTLPYDSLAQLRAALYTAHPHFAGLDTIAPGAGESIVALAKGKAKADKAAFQNAVPAFHLTNAIARASKIMAECAALAAGQGQVAAE